jgi:hypothetical protein
MSFVLVTGAASAAAYKVKSLFNSDNLLFGDYEPLPPMPSLRILPSPSSASYIADFLKFCLEENITQVYTIRRKEVSALMNAKPLFEEYGIQLVLPTKLDQTQIPTFQTATCSQMEKRSDGLFWHDEHNIYLFICD